MPAFKGIFVSDPVEFTAKLGSESVTIVFDNAKKSLRRDREIRRAADNGDIDGMVRELMAMLVSWDVVDEQGSPVLLSEEILLDLPDKALRSLVTLMGEAGQPSDAEGEASSAPSPGPSTTSSAMPPTHQNGPAPSELPVPSASPS